MTVASPGLQDPVSSADRLSREQLRVGIASFFGNAVEQYDFFGYGTGAALAFPSVFIPMFRRRWRHSWRSPPSPSAISFARSVLWCSDTSATGWGASAC
jgi:hypothetical protein